ncbi:MAG TPA: hypothetical protein VLN90_07430, partial [Thioalkalivibrio sp.]|nr:hypothetical protein [Thioalkalivibrio sp.]
SGDQQDEREDIQLPEVDLPLGLVVRDLDLGTFSVNEGKIWDRLQVQAEGSGADWHLRGLQFVRDDIEVTGSGRLQTRGDWPLDLEADIQLPPPYGPGWELALNLSGSAADLRVQGRSSGYLGATLEGRLAPLESELPARLTVKSPEFVPAEGLPETLVLEDTVVNLEGSLENGFRSDSRTSLPGTAGDIAVTLGGLVTTAGVEGLDLQLTGPGAGDAKTGRLVVAGDMDWQETFRVAADVDLDDFPWYSLIPDLEQPPVALRELDGNVRYQAGAYQADVKARVSGPQGGADMAAELDGDLESVAVTGLRVDTGAGFLGGQCDVTFADQLSWDASLELDGFNPGYWLPALEASLNGGVRTSGRLADNGAPSLQAEWDLSGDWQANEALIKGALEGDGGVWALSGLVLEVGDNRVSGQGQWGPEISGKLALELPSPETLLPGLAGSLDGTASVSGTAEQPKGEASLTGSDLVWQDDLSLSRLDLAAELREGFDVEADLKGSELRYGDQLLQEVALALTGTRDNHQLTLEAVHKEAELALSLTGAAAESWNAWAGSVERGQIDIPEHDQRWSLSGPAELAYTVAGRLTFGNHCWRWQQASVCAEDQTLLPNQDIAYRIDNFPTTALAPLMPETLRWDSNLDADLRLVMTEDGPDGELSLDAGTGEFEVLAGEDWETLGYDTFTTRLRLQPEVADLDLQLQGPQIGDLSVTTSVDPTDPDRELSGQFRIQGLDISVAGAFAGLETVEGELNGEGSLSGPLVKPAVNGEITLSGGRIADPRLPIPLEDMAVSLDLNGYSADLTGRWRSNERSTGNLDGALAWESEPSVELNITGNRLPLSYDPYARVE